MLRKAEHWIVLIGVSLIGAVILEFHVLHWDMAASIFTAFFVFLFGIFVKQIIRREIRTVFTEQSNTKGSGG